MRILRVISQFPPFGKSGPANQALRLTEAQTKQGYDSTVITSRYSERRRTIVEERNGYRIHWCPVLLQIGNTRITKDTMKVITRLDVDIVHVHEYRSAQVEVAARLTKLRQMPFVLTTHGTVGAYHQILRKPIHLLPYILYDTITRKYVLRNASAIIATSKIEADQLVRFGLDKARIRVIPHGINTDRNLRISENIVEKTGIPRLLFVGRLSAARDVQTLIRAMKLVKDVFPDTELHICGDFIQESLIPSNSNNQESFFRLIKEMNLEKNVKFQGWLSNDDLLREYLEADVFVWPSLYDNFGHALVEAAFAGLPIVSTCVGIAPEIIGNNEGGFIFRKMDWNMMATSIIHLLQDESLRNDAGKHVKIQSKRYSIENMVESYDRVYREILEN